MNYESFFQAVQQNAIEIPFDRVVEGASTRLSNEALFHLPLLAVTVLMISKGSRKPKVDELGQIVGECFERTFVGFKGSSQHLDWSANLRVRTIRALTFLEVSGLVAVDREKSRIATTERGRVVIDAALASESELALVLRKVERSYGNIGAERQIAMGFT